MSPKRVEYHQGAIADVKSAVAWYRKRSRKAALDFIEELHRAADTIREAPERWPLEQNNTRRFLLWRFPFAIIYSEHESAITGSPVTGVECVCWSSATWRNFARRGLVFRLCLRKAGG